MSIRTKRSPAFFVTVLIAWVGFCLAFSASCALRAGGPGARLGRAHDFELEDINPRSASFGKRLSLRELYAERGLVLQFTASWCEYCREELPQVERLHSEGPRPIVLMAADEGGGPESMLILAERNGLTTPILFVPGNKTREIEKHYAYEVLPATYLIDRAGAIRSVHQGATAAKRLLQAIESELR